MPDPDSADQVERDAHEVWTYAINAAIGPPCDDPTDPKEHARIAAARRERFTRYARFVLHDLEVDPDRLVAVERIAQAEAAADQPGWAATRELVEAAAELLRTSGADLNLAARERLRAELTDENTWDPPPYRQGPWHRHNWPRRALRRLDPRYWARRVHARATIRMVHHSASVGRPRYQQIEMILGGVQIGCLDYMTCTDCQIGFVGKISVDPDLQGRGLGTRALKLARAGAPGLRWCTSGQYVTARTFWRSIGRRTGQGYRPADSDLRPCVHLAPWLG